jgi:DNA polymerase-3 subunit epsilon
VSAFARALAITFAAVAGVLGLAGAGFWAGLDAAGREQIAEVLARHAELVATLCIVLAVVLGIVAHALYRRYVELPQLMAEEVLLIAGPNPAHRIAAGGPQGLRSMARSINRMAERLGDAEGQIRLGVENATAGLSEERNRLAALMSELAQCVLVCNSEGRILLYNAAALSLIDASAPAGAQSTTRIGLGRPVFTIIDRERIVHAQERIAERMVDGESRPVARFVCVARDGRLLRAQMAPVLDVAGAQTGYVILLEDATQAVEGAARGDALMQSLTESSRASLASIRAAGEALRSYPDMDAQAQHRFMEIINEEAEGLSARVDGVAQAYSALQSRYGSGAEEILGSDLVQLAARRIEGALGLEVRTEPGSTPPWLDVDSYLLVAALVIIARHLRDGLGARALAIELAPAGGFAELDICWQGAPATPEIVNSWESEPVPGSPESASLRTIIEARGGNAWYAKEQVPGTSRYRILVPVAGAVRAAPALQGRPEFYDFDLFHQPGQTPELDLRRLDDLAYTVFDTETTGLQPSAGDAILQIGATRIVAGKLRREDAFEQLVNPQRDIPAVGIAIHGIEPVMVADAPTIDAVLPSFAAYAHDTVLVAHNAAFDMRFLELQRERTGVAFDQPVLDTLLLSAVVHPAQESHRLEAIAQRLGVPVLGRHTALGDAMVTAEVFLKLIPLLGERGIHTLGQALEASQKTYLARVSY